MAIPWKARRTRRVYLGALKRDLLEYQFSEDNDVWEGDKPLLLMTTSSFMSLTKESPASLSPVELVGPALGSRSREIQKLLHESPRRRRIDDTMRVTFHCQRRNGRDTKVNLNERREPSVLHREDLGPDT